MDERRQSPANPPQGTETILLVEDEEGVRELSSRVLARLGYTVLKARRPSEAIRLSEEYVGPIHLLLTDVMMPEMDGHELAALLAASRPDIGILFISGYADRMSHGSTSNLLPKPFTPAILARKLREILDTPAP